MCNIVRFVQKSQHSTFFFTFMLKHFAEKFNRVALLYICAFYAFWLPPVCLNFCATLVSSEIFFYLLLS